MTLNVEWIGDFIVPAIILITVIYGFCKKVDVFDAFCSGVKQGLSSTVSIIPSVFALVVAVGMLKSSNALALICKFLSPVTDFFHIPEEILSLALIRPVSGSGATAVLNNIFTTNSPDSLIGKTASVLAGSTETTFYAVAVYFGAVNIKNTRHTIPSALCADLTSLIVSCALINIFER